MYWTDTVWSHFMPINKHFNNVQGFVWQSEACSSEGVLHISKPPQTKSRIDFRRHSPTAGRFNQAKYWQFGVQYRLYYGRIICALNPRIKSSRYSIFFKSLILQFCQLQRTSNEIYLNIVSVFFVRETNFESLKFPQNPSKILVYDHDEGGGFLLWSFAWWSRAQSRIDPNVILHRNRLCKFTIALGYYFAKLFRWKIFRFPFPRFSKWGIRGLLDSSGDYAKIDHFKKDSANQSSANCPLQSSSLTYARFMLGFLPIRYVTLNF